MTETQLRQRILEHAEKVVIKRNGEIHAYGIMPNTNRTGWYFYGLRAELARMFATEQGA